MLVKVRDLIFPENKISYVSCERLASHGEVIVYNSIQDVTLKDIEAIDFLMRYCPQMLEGKRFRWAKRAWAFHNLVAHPLLHVLASVGLTRLGMRIHDASVPRPKGKR